MKIAVPVHNGFVNDHFGHSENFTVYTISSEKNIESAQPVPSLVECGCKSGIAQILAEQGVTILLAGNIGAGAIHHMHESGIEVVRGCRGKADSVVTSFLEGTVKDIDQVCTAHEGCNKH